MTQTIRLEQLGIAAREKRGNRGIREVAQEIGISAATLSRIETGKQPDLDTFTKICRWLKVNPSEVLSFSHEDEDHISTPQTFSVQFRAHKTLTPETAKKLGEMIIAAQNMITNEGQ